MAGPTCHHFLWQPQTLNTRPKSQKRLSMITGRSDSRVTPMWSSCATSLRAISIKTSAKQQLSAYTPAKTLREAMVWCLQPNGSFVTLSKSPVATCRNPQNSKTLPLKTTYKPLQPTLRLVILSLRSLYACLTCSVCLLTCSLVVFLKNSSSLIFSTTIGLAFGGLYTCVDGIQQP